MHYFGLTMLIPIEKRALVLVLCRLHLNIKCIFVNFFTGAGTVGVC
jgi:hypothetical protein